MDKYNKLFSVYNNGALLIDVLKAHEWDTLGTYSFLLRCVCHCSHSSVCDCSSSSSGGDDGFSSSSGDGGGSSSSRTKE